MKGLITTLVLFICITISVEVLSESSSFKDRVLPISSTVNSIISIEGADRITKTMQKHVDEGRLPGVMTMISHKGNIVYGKALGMRDIESEDPLELDDIFRIYSMTKPITSTAIMMLVEKGKISLDDPVSKFIPAFENLEVLAEDGTRRAAKRAISIRHLLSHTSGLTYGKFGDSKVDKIYLAADLFRAKNLNHFVNNVAKLPLLSHPGEKWNYSVSTDILGFVVQVASGKPFEDFLAEEIFKPLKMDDTAFWVPKDKIERFVSRYQILDDNLQLKDSFKDSKYNSKPAIISGGGGLVSTASDYIRFAQMLLQGGQLEGVRLLQPETVDMMRSTQLPESHEPITIPGWIPPAYGFGLGFATLIDQEVTSDADHNGIFRWGGVANTFFWIDPEVELIAMVWTQLDPFLVYSLENEFQSLVYQAIEETKKKEFNEIK
nr:serine hydrolase domain-containing protein [uncultured Glaciecola sp.]